MPRRDFPTIPREVRERVREVFAACNAHVSSRLSGAPNTHEETLDLSFIDAITPFAAPMRFRSGWLLRIVTYFLGGRRQFHSWEIDDIGVLLIFRKGGHVRRTKIILLQSKRLYPREQEYDEAEPADYEIGFARLFGGDTSFESISTPCMFIFDDQARYQALRVGTEQLRAIEDYERRFAIPVYYLLYHPWSVPYSIEVPRRNLFRPRGKPQAGCRVLPSEVVRQSLTGRPDGYTPSYGEVRRLRPRPRDPSLSGWRIEEFIANLSLDCKTGYRATSEADPGLERVSSRRTGPIAAAIALTFDAP